MKRKIDPAARNALWLIGGRCMQLGIQLAAGLLVARYLGPSDYGLLSYAGAYAGFFAALCHLGLPSTLVKELTEAPEREGEILGTSLGLRVASSLLSAGMLLLLVCVTDWGDQVVLTAAGLSALGMVLQAFEVFHCWFQWHLRSQVTAAALLTACILTAGYKLALLVLGKQVIWFAAATVVDHTASGLLLLFCYRRLGGGKLRFSLSWAKQLLSRSCHFILPGLMAAVYAQTDKIMLRLLAGDAQVGLYATAVTLCNVWCFVLSAIIDSACPGITQAHLQNRADFQRQNRRLYALVFYLSGAVSLGITALAKPGIGLLYGRAYLGAVVPLQILTWHTAFSYLGVARNIWIVCENAQKHLLWVYGAGAAANVGLNLLLIPRYGAAGAAAASLVSQVVTAIVAPFFIGSLRENGKLMLQGIFLRGIGEGKP